MSYRVKLGSILVLYLVVVLLIAGCSSSADKAVENVIGGLIEAENEAIEAGLEQEETTDTDSGDEAEGTGQFQVDKSATWPDDMPAYVPAFDGKLVAVVTTYPEDNYKNHTIAYEDLKDTTMGSYEQALINKGWNIDAKTDMGGDGWLIHAGHDSGSYITALVEPGENSGVINVTVPD